MAPTPNRRDPAQRQATRAREAEYQAIWQACERTTRKDEYQEASVEGRRAILQNALSKLLEKRARNGKEMAGSDINDMVERHLSREAEAEQDARADAEVAAAGAAAQATAAGRQNGGCDENEDIYSASDNAARPAPAAAPQQQQQRGRNATRNANADADDPLLLPHLLSNVRTLQSDNARLHQTLAGMTEHFESIRLQNNALISNHSYILGQLTKVHEHPAIQELNSVVGVLARNMHRLEIAVATQARSAGRNGPVDGNAHHDKDNDKKQKQ